MDESLAESGRDFLGSTYVPTDEVANLDSLRSIHGDDQPLIGATLLVRDDRYSACVAFVEQRHCEDAARV
jgi:hypothetical protein